MNFNELVLNKRLLTCLESNQFTSPTPIQQLAIPAILEGKDVMGIAKTGSGKTASFVLPIVMHVNENLETQNRHIKVLVLVPTRELANQIKDVFQLFGNALNPGIKTKAVFGGVSINPQMIGLQGTHILVATPGRLLDLIASKALSLSAVETLVLDEADKLLHLGFQEEMNQIIALLPKKRQNVLFSATLNSDVSAITQLILNEPIVIQIEEEEDSIDSIQQLAYSISEEKKGPLLRYLLNESKFEQVLIFTSSAFKADSVTEKLKKNGIPATAIHSKKSQNSRTEALLQFKRGKINVLVTTDLLSRGIDIENLPCVINYELPRSPKDYIHRIGRTGRAGSEGIAISLITPDEEHHFKIIQKKMKRTVELKDGNELVL